MPPVLWRHQKETYDLKCRSPVLFDQSDPGTGKTLAQLHYIYQTGKTALVLCPKTLMAPAWGGDIKTFYPDMPYSLCYAENREEAFAEDAQVFITNVDAVRWLVKQPKSFFARFDLLIIDESTSYKNPTAKRTKSAMKIARFFDERVCMSGTPMTKSVQDLWAQVYILDFGQRLGTNFHRFRFQCCIPERVGVSPHAVRWIDKEGIEEEVSELIRDISIRHRLDECLDIPPNHVHWVRFDLPERAYRQYKTLAKEAVLEFENNQVATAVNAAVLQNKLLQLASGAIYTSDGGWQKIDNTRVNLVMDLVETREASLVFFIWQHQKKLLLEEAAKRKLDVAVIDGNVPVRERNRICDDFQAGRYQALFLHPRTAAHGLTLTRAKTNIWVSPVFEADLIKQGIARIVRGSQTCKTETIFIAANDTVDDYVYGVVNGRVDQMEILMKCIEAIRH